MDPRVGSLSQAAERAAKKAKSPTRKKAGEKGSKRKAPKKKSAAKGSEAGRKRDADSDRKSGRRKKKGSGGDDRSSGGSRSKRSKGRKPKPSAGTPPRRGVGVVGAHPVGSEVMGEVQEFSSHGAYVEVDAVRCYLPLKSMGDPPPRSAKDVDRRSVRSGSIASSRRSTHLVAASIWLTASNSDRRRRQRKPTQAAR
ncbi:MAG: S1 RNA-binding domain-containing protein [Acidimicrobiia bacterium]|nr:S1 RNA-binding domain-containing protein [Acidimicrobiia bacterium]